jgi:anoctamin-8
MGYYSLQHIILMFKMMIAYAIPDLPQWVAEEKARLEFLRREALKVSCKLLNHFIENILSCNNNKIF